MEKKSTNPWAKVARKNVVELVRNCGGMFRYAMAIERTFEKSFSDMGNPYKRITTFASDFAIAECHGDNAVKDTYRRASASWMGDYKFFTELTMVLNWYCWFWYDNGEPGLSKIYADLYYKSKDDFYKHYESRKSDTEEERSRKEEARSYFFETLD